MSEEDGSLAPGLPAEGDRARICHDYRATGRAIRPLAAKSMLSKPHFPSFSTVVVEISARLHKWTVICENKRLPQTPAIQEDSHV